MDSTITRSAAAAVAGVASIALLLATVACGGSGVTRPKPLTVKFDEVHLSSLAIEKKDAMFKAQDQYQRARGEHAKVVDDLRLARTAVNVAKNELGQAKLAEKTAAEKKRLAEDSGDMNKVNPAMKEARVAELARRAADEKIDARKAEVRYLEKLELFAQEEAYHKEARLEQIKAKIARDNEISPKGFVYNKYEEQAQERSRQAQKAKSIADQQERKAIEAKKKWTQAQEQVRGARGDGA